MDGEMLDQTLSNSSDPSMGKNVVFDSIKQWKNLSSYCRKSYNQSCVVKIYRIFFSFVLKFFKDKFDIIICHV